MVRWTWPLGLGAVALAALGMGLGRPRVRLEDASYPFGSPAFSHFVADSYKSGNAGSAKQFFDWFNSHFKAQAGAAPEAYLAKRKLEIDALREPGAKGGAQMKLGGDLHRIIKKTIPKFSLERGFEFYNTAQLGERQCFLQSVLVAGLLQKAGVRAGVAMVYKNIEGQATNNGHAVAIARLADNRDVIVDCSDPTPFVEQKGLFLRNGEKSYLYVEPVYGASHTISAYRGNGTVLSPGAVAMLDVAFIDSQFDYYRGERAEHGIFDAHPTPAGLQRSAAFLRKSIQENPANPLAVYMLGNVYRKLGNKDLARRQYQQAQVLYAKDGWLPQGLTDALALH